MALFSEETLSPNFSAFETSNQVLSAYQAAHLKLGYANRQLLLKSLLYVKISSSHQGKISIYIVLSTEVLCCMLMALKVQLLNYSKYPCNRITAGSPTASPRMLHTIKVHSITVFKMYSLFDFASFQPCIAGILNYWEYTPSFKFLEER